MTIKKSTLSRLLSAGATAIIMLAGCGNDEQKPRKTANPDHLFFDYRILGDEERNLVTVTLQFRKESMIGDAVVLAHPARVEVDGVELEPDSSKMNGVFYELSRAVGDFEGDHSIIVTGLGGKQFTEEFYFSAMELKTRLPATMPRKDLVLDLEGLDSSDLVHVILTDTSFRGEGIDRVDTVRDGRITISKADLAELRSGPVFLEFYKEDSRPLKQTTPAGGRLITSYSLKRAFELADADR